MQNQFFKLNKLIHRDIGVDDKELGFEFGNICHLGDVTRDENGNVQQNIGRLFLHPFLIEFYDMQKRTRTKSIKIKPYLTMKRALLLHNANNIVKSINKNLLC